MSNIIKKKITRMMAGDSELRIEVEYTAKSRECELAIFRSNKLEMVADFTMGQLDELTNFLNQVIAHMEDDAK